MGVRSTCMAICLFAASCEPAFAQDAELNMPDKCQLAPQTDSQATKSDQSSQSRSRSLTEKLDPCDGVLKPPDTGDEQIAMPPPATGEMPVVEPNEVPEQPPVDQ